MYEATIPLNFDSVPDVPFADLRFPTPSGKVEIYCDAMRDAGVDPLPEFVPASEYANGRRDSQLMLISAAAHHYVSTSMGNLPKLTHKEGAPHVQMHPEDAAERGIADGDDVIVENERGWVRLVAELSTDMQRGLVVSPKGQWPRLSPGGRNVNRLTSDAVADLAGQSTFHSNLVEIRLAGPQDADPDLQDLAAVAIG
jgi:anaerobic selenocysteine-containing dehydrogenase